MRKKIIKIAICAVLLSVFTIRHSQAGTWRDEFDGNEFIGWERVVKENPWFADWRLVEGALIGEILDRPQEQLITSDFLHWNAHQFELDRITVEGEEINYQPHGHDIHLFGQFCLFLGKRRPPPDFAEGYIFSPEETVKIKLSAKGDFNKGNSKAKYGLMWRLTRGHLKVVFHAGRFRLLAQDILVTEFSDPDIPIIDVVGLMVVCGMGKDCWFYGSISAFSVSGKGIPNHNSLNVQLGNMQLATTWGGLKVFD